MKSFMKNKDKFLEKSPMQKSYSEEIGRFVQRSHMHLFDNYCFVELDPDVFNFK